MTMMMGQDMHSNHCAQVDTADQAKVTPFLHLLHKYKAFSSSFNYPIRLIAPLGTTLELLHLGVGYIHSPSEYDTGNPSYINILGYYSL